MISVLRKEACPGSIHDLAYIPTQNCLADCSTKASAKADNLITAVRTGRLLDVDMHPDFRTLMEHRPSYPLAAEHSYTQEKDFFFLNALRISLARIPQEGPFHVMFVGFSAYRPAEETEHLWSPESRYYENNVYTRRFTHSISLGR